jgi:hypothetical protein
VHRDFVAGVFKWLVWKLLGLALDLLHGKNIGVRALQPINHPTNSGANAVYVVSGYAHGLYSPISGAAKPNQSG